MSYSIATKGLSCGRQYALETKGIICIVTVVIVAIKKKVKGPWERLNKWRDPGALYGRKR